MNKSILFALAALLGLTNITFAQIVFDGGTDGTGVDFFDEANWVDTATGADPAADTINPNGGSFTGITSNLTIGGSFAVEGAVVIGNIRLTDGQTLTLQDDATLFSQVFSAPGGEAFNVVLTDNAELTVTQNIARSAFDISGNANLVFTGNAPEFDIDTLNLSSDWTGSITSTTSRLLLEGAAGTGLFDTVTIDGVPITIDDIETVTVGGNVVHTLASSILPGDVDLSGEVDFLDIGPFIGILSDGGFQDEADVDGSGVVDFLDIGPFIALLSNQ